MSATRGRKSMSFIPRVLLVVVFDELIVLYNPTTIIITVEKPRMIDRRRCWSPASIDPLLNASVSLVIPSDGMFKGISVAAKLTNELTFKSITMHWFAISHTSSVVEFPLR